MKKRRVLRDTRKQGNSRKKNGPEKKLREIEEKTKTGVNKDQGKWTQDEFPKAFKSAL